MKLGFTGTSDGMTQYQKDCVGALLEEMYELGFRTFNHGDCIGADAEAHEIALKIGYKIHIYPPDKDVKRAFCEGAEYVHEELPYLVRDHLIVDNSIEMIGTPNGAERLRSGTWATIRYSEKSKKPLYIVFPGGNPLSHDQRKFLNGERPAIDTFKIDKK